MLHLTLRGATGRTLSAMLPQCQVIGVTVDCLSNQSAVATLPSNTQLPIMDWAMLGRTPRLAFTTVCALITGACIHELGYAEPGLGQNQPLYMSVEERMFAWLEEVDKNNLSAFRQSRFGGVVPMVTLATDRELPANFHRSICRKPRFDNEVFIEQPIGGMARHDIPLLHQLAEHAVMEAWVARTGTEEAARIFLERQYIDIVRVDGDSMVFE